jgi:SAM-dependent methyltransferase
VEDGGVRVLVLDDLRHSAVDLDDPRRLEFAYVRWIGDAIDGLRPAGAPLDAVYVGGGGFTLPRYTAATRPGSTARVLEVDGQLVDLARDELGLRTGPGLRVTVGDARVTLRGLPAASADLVVGDAFGSRAVPWHLATAEWMADVRRVLRPGGLFAANVIDQPPARPAARAGRHPARRVRRRPPRRPAGPAGGNQVLLASDGRCRPRSARLPGARGPSTGRPWRASPPGRTSCATTTRRPTSSSARAEGAHAAA